MKDIIGKIDARPKQNQLVRFLCYSIWMARKILSISNKLSTWSQMKDSIVKREAPPELNFWEGSVLQYLDGQENPINVTAQRVSGLIRWYGKRPKKTGHLWKILSISIYNGSTSRIIKGHAFTIISVVWLWINNGQWVEKAMAKSKKSGQEYKVVWTVQNTLHYAQCTASTSELSTNLHLIDRTRLSLWGRCYLT